MSTVSLKTHYQTIILIILAVLVLWGFLLRTWNLGEQSLWIDEGFSINAAQAIIDNGYPKLESGELYTASPLNTYIIAGMINVFGFDPANPWTARLPSVFFGIGVILLSYILSANILRSKKLALVVAAVMALSFWEIEWSRQARGYIELQFFMLGSLFYFWRWLDKSDLKHLLISFFSGVAAFLSQAWGIVLLPVVAVAFIAHRILHPDKKIKKKPLIFFAVLVTTGILAVALPRILNLKLYNFTPIYLSYLFGSLKAITWASIAGIGLGIFDKKRFWPVMFLAIAFLFPLLLVVKYSPLVQMRYLFPLFPMMVILSVYAVWRVLELVPLSNFSKFKPILVVVITFALFQGSLVLAPQDFYHLEPDSPRPNFKEAYALINKEKTAGDIVISPYAHLNKIYLGEKGYWLPISLTGKKSELERTIIDGQYDYYVGAPIIENPQHLKELIENHYGFVLVDGMAKIRLNRETIDTLQGPDVVEIYSSGAGRLNKIWVYQF